MYYKKILAAVDVSDSSKEAYKHALALAKLTGGEVLILNVAISEKEDKGGFSKGILDSVLDLCDTSGVTVKTKTAYGRPARAIVNTALTEKVDLIITGGHSYGPIESIFQGSVSSRVVQLAPCPVMVVNDYPGIHEDVQTCLLT